MIFAKPGRELPSPNIYTNAINIKKRWFQNILNNIGQTIASWGTPDKQSPEPVLW